MLIVNHVSKNLSCTALQIMIFHIVWKSFFQSSNLTVMPFRMLQVLPRLTSYDRQSEQSLFYPTILFWFVLQEYNLRALPGFATEQPSSQAIMLRTCGRKFHQSCDQFPAKLIWENAAI